MEDEPSRRSSSDTRYALTVALVKPGRAACRTSFSVIARIARHKPSAPDVIRGATPDDMKLSGNCTPSFAWNVRV
jgi:hypothetical protein